jgi:hypothetical protein
MGRNMSDSSFKSTTELADELISVHPTIPTNAPETPREQRNVLEDVRELDDTEHEHAGIPDSEEEPPDSPASVPNKSNELQKILPIIWTPRFFLGWLLTLVLGLSVMSVMTTSWSNDLFIALPFSVQIILLLEIALVALVWLTIGIFTHSFWLRVGSLFGGLWTLFMVISVLANSWGMSATSEIQAYFNVASCVSLLGGYLGLVSDKTLLNRWDHWLVAILLPGIILGSGGTYLLTPSANHLTIENAIAAGALISSCALWWLRPSCWKTQPGLTFLFGVVPLILLLQAVSNSSMHNMFLLQIANPAISSRSNSNNFFLVQVALLALFLGFLRLLKSEKSH